MSAVLALFVPLILTLIAVGNDSSLFEEELEGNRELTDFKKEIRSLSMVHHPNIVLFIGACFAPMCVVLEYAERGSLLDVIKADLKSPSTPSRAQFTVSRKLKVLTGAARGMAYLHANGLIHVRHCALCCIAGLTVKQRCV